MRLFSIVILTGFLVVSNVQASDDPAYFGIKAGPMTTSVSGLDDAFNGGLLAGYDFGPYALEGEVTASLVSGDTSLPGVEWDVTTIALYGVYRSPGDIYFKGKIGFLNEDVNIDVGGFSFSGSDSGGSFGLGAGWKLGEGSRIEFEYAIVEEDIDFISLAYIF